jgi:cytosine/adenosine deaminase-related metal-dependent hydrolase
LLSGIQSTVEPTPTAGDALIAATSGGAAAVGLAGRVGTLDPGACADLTLLDLSDPAFLPLNDVARQLVFSESGRSVRSVVVGGRVLVRDGVSTSFDGRSVRALVEDVWPGFLADATRVASESELLHPYVLEAERQFWAAPSP